MHLMDLATPRANSSSRFIEAGKALLDELEMVLSERLECDSYARRTFFPLLALS